MTSSLLHSASREDLEQTLRILRDYRNAHKQIGKKAVLRDTRIQPDATVRIQFAVPLDQTESLMPFVEKVLSRHFPDAQDAPRTREYHPSLVGGIRIFYGDDMVDISFDTYAHIATASL